MQSNILPAFCSLYSTAIPDTITCVINAEFEICMLTILHRSLPNYYKSHRTTMAPLLSDVPPLAIINKVYSSFQPLSDYYPRNIESITPRGPYYRYCYRRSSNIIIS